jgi:acyl-coenzyme A synthetase/AMP-(fatty) acid ligase
MRPDGLAEFLGRRDRRIKIRGQRADPADLEDALRMLPGIADVAVIVRPVDDEASLVAYAVAANPAEPPDPGVLRGLLTAVLPSYMIPAAIRILPVIPRLHNFKPDLVALNRLA